MSESRDWAYEPVPMGEDGRSFAAVIGELRRVQSLVNSTRPSDDVADLAAARLGEIAELLAPWSASEWRSPAGKRIDLPGRGHPLLPHFVIGERTAEAITARVVFDRFYLGGNDAVHGGALSLLFDEVLGLLGNPDVAAIARTAYLHVNYRSIAPLDVELELRGAYDRCEGRKRYISGTLHHGNVIVADDEELFVELLAGQR